MGSGASVAVAQKVQTIIKAPLQSAHQTVYLHTVQNRLFQAHRSTSHWYGLLDDNVISKVTKKVEIIVLSQLQQLLAKSTDYIKSKYVEMITKTSIAMAFNIDIHDVKHIILTKRKYQVFSSGPELPNVPSLDVEAQELKLQDFALIDQLLNQCRWVMWKPTMSWRMKINQIFDLTIHIANRQHGFLVNDGSTTLKLRVGKQWVGPHHHEIGLQLSMRQLWLHQVDYNPSKHSKRHIKYNQIDSDEPNNKASEFYNVLDFAWQEYCKELQVELEENLIGNDGLSTTENDRYAMNDREYMLEEKYVSRRIQYLIETGLEKIMNDSRTAFTSTSQYELWRMEQEESNIFREGDMHLEQSFYGPLLHAPEETFNEGYEARTMAKEDITVFKELID